jgi:hypothetical protein
MKTLPQSCQQCLEQFSTALEELMIYANRGAVKGYSESQSRELIIHFELAHELALKVIAKYFENKVKVLFRVRGMPPWRLSTPISSTMAKLGWIW